MALRSRLIAWLLVLVAGLAVAHYAQVWAAIPAPQARTSDYAGTYVASTLWRDGRAAAMYDVPVEEQVMLATGAPSAHVYIPFENPPLAAVVASPFSLLDAAGAYRAWSLLQLALVAAAVVITLRAAPRPSGRRDALTAIGAVAFAAFGTGLLFVEGQWDGFAVLGLALAYAGWRRGRSLGPGFAVGFSAALAKPHLAAGVVGFMLGRRDWRGLAGALLGALTVAAAGLLLAGPAALGAFVRAILEPANSPTAQMQGASGIFGSLLGGGGVPLLLTVCVGVGAVTAAAWLGAVSRRRRDLLEPAFLGASALSLFASPHLLGHDLTLLAPAFVAASVWSAHRDTAMRRIWPSATSLGSIGGWAALSLSTLSDLGKNSVGFPGRLTPWVLGAACVAMIAGVRATTRGARSGRRVAFALSASRAARS